MTAPPRTAGRPRNAEHSALARQAALDLLREHGYASINMEAVAERTGIAKQTLYRRWKHKRALILDAFAEQADHLPPLPTTADPEEELRAFTRATCRALTGQCGATNRALMAEALQSPEFLVELRERHLVKRRRQLRRILERQQPELGDQQLETLVDLILGPMWYRLLVQNAPLDDDFADLLARTSLEAAAASG
ncbi:TetR/AcrR family transcriptional regulator [Deinococcus humi]|uniref:AcrR family transcriptional regulator n=1 Tax=Deinococcus humi TaxID=662880 RepID=A0A7W8JYP8_9DEIO|nr:TetR/AcrR family transcriptional regulator [Deinococcus humi]MBB5365243.1 AcrR family transcriptional regulator [Deinococcus humi]GGO35730.1 TetR family transcriptional regulator [Deinococcus humi]